MLEETINSEIKAAMLAKDSQRLEALRGIKSTIILLKTSPEGYNDQTEAKALQKMVKQRKETAEIYNNQGRKDLADVELFQANVIEAYLPKQMSNEELTIEITKLIAELGVVGPEDLGKVIGLANRAVAGRADRKQVATIVRQLLTQK